MTRSSRRAIGETDRRRAKQVAWNEAHGITPQTIKRQINDIIRSVAERDYVTVDLGADAPAALTGLDLHAYIGQLEKQMREAAANLEFEEAARLRDEIRKLEDKELGLATERRPSPRAARQRCGLEAHLRLARRQAPRGAGQVQGAPAGGAVAGGHREPVMPAGGRVRPLAPRRDHRLNRRRWCGSGARDRSRRGNLCAIVRSCGKFNVVPSRRLVSAPS